MTERTLMCLSCDSEYTIEYDEDAVSGKDCYCPFCGHMNDLAFIFAIYRGGDFCLCAVRTHENADIARLSAACCIKHGAVENDTVTLIDA